MIRFPYFVERCGIGVSSDSVKPSSTAPLPSERPLVFIINSLMHGGAQRLVVSDINEALRRGIDVRLITIQSERLQDSLRSACHLSDDMHRTILFSSLFSLQAWVELIQCLRAWRPRAVITHLWFSSTVARLAAWIVGTPRILAFEHNVYGTRKRGRHYAIDRLLARVSTSVIAVSEAVRSFLIEQGIPEGKIRVLLNAVDTQAYATPSLLSYTRSQFGIPPSTCVAISVGRLIPQKGFDLLIPLFTSLPEGVLLVVGDGHERDYLTRLIQEHHLEHRIKLLGTRNDIPQLLALADVFVLPSRWEGLPIVILEAMAAGLPIVATAVQGTGEVLVHDQTGLLVPPEQPQALREALERLFQNPELRTRLGSAARIAVNRYSIETHVDGLLEYCGAS